MQPLFPYAVGFNLTFFETADPSVLKKMGLNVARCQEMIGETYTFHETPLGEKKEAIYRYEWLKEIQTGKIVKHENSFLYDPSLRNQSLEYNIETAAHELKHCEERHKLAAYDNWPKVGAVGGFLSSAYTFQHIVPAVIGAGVGYASGIAYQQSRGYAIEESAYAFMENMACVLGSTQRKPSVPLGSVTAQPSITEKYITGYPGSDTIHAIKQEARDRHIKDGLPVYTNKQVYALHQKTQKNMPRYNFIRA